MQKLQNKYDALIQQLCPAEPSLPQVGATSSQPLFVDLGLAAVGADDPGGQTANALLNIIAQAPSATQELLEADIALLERVRDSATDQTPQMPFGLMEAVLPICLKGSIVYCLWTGKLRHRDLFDDEVARLADESGQSKDDILATVADVPVLTEAHIKKMVFLYRRLRDALAQRLEMAERINELTDQLVQSERTSSLGTLSSGVAHHFNNLLSIILGYSSYVLNREELTSEAETALHQISDAAQRGRRLTEELLAFAGSDVEEERICNIHDTLGSVMSLLSSQMSSQILMQSDFAARQADVMAPKSSIHQIVFNLLTNALDSLPEGGQIDVKTGNVKVEGEDGLQDYIRVEVLDNAAVVNDEEQIDAYGPDEEIGLKLSSVYGIVGKLAGTVMISTPPGGVRKVEVLLPTVVGVGSDTPQPSVEQEAPPPSVIWVVDDDSTFREMCCVVLAEEGHTVEELSGGKELKKQWESDAPRPGVIIIDFSMPEYNGLELCEWLHKRGSEVPVVLVSGLSIDQPHISKAKKMKRIHFLQKPFSFRELADMVTMAMGESLITE
ncbi:MAG: response regulator [Spartobacteria bacterium]|nr:response regulator [Spartobacteria bacterium]